MNYEELIKLAIELVESLKSDKNKQIDELPCVHAKKLRLCETCEIDQMNLAYEVLALTTILEKLSK